MGEKVRMVFEFGPELNSIIERLSESLGITKVDVIRKAVGLYDEARKEVKVNRGEVLFRNKEDGTRKLIIP